MRLCFAVAALAFTSIALAQGDDRASVIKAFGQKCKHDREKHDVSNAAIDKMKIDTTGLCICVALTLSHSMSDKKILELTSQEGEQKELQNVFDAARNYCVTLYQTIDKPQQ